MVIRPGNNIAVRQPDGQVVRGTVDSVGTNNGRQIVNYTARDGSSSWSYLCDVLTIQGRAVPLSWSTK